MMHAVPRCLLNSRWFFRIIVANPHVTEPRNVGRIWVAEADARRFDIPEDSVNVRINVEFPNAVFSPRSTSRNPLRRSCPRGSKNIAIGVSVVVASQDTP